MSSKSTNVYNQVLCQKDYLRTICSFLNIPNIFQSIPSVSTFHLKFVNHPEQSKLIQSCLLCDLHRLSHLIDTTLKYPNEQNNKNNNKNNKTKNTVNEKTINTINNDDHRYDTISKQLSVIFIPWLHFKHLTSNTNNIYSDSDLNGFEITNMKISKLITHLNSIITDPKPESINQGLKQVAIVLRDIPFDAKARLEMDILNKKFDLWQDKLYQVLPHISNLINENKLNGYWKITWFTASFVEYTDEWPWIFSDIMSSFSKALLIHKISSDKAGSLFLSMRHICGNNKLRLVLNNANLIINGVKENSNSKINIGDSVLEYIKNNENGIKNNNFAITMAFQIVLLVKGSEDKDIEWFVQDGMALERIIEYFRLSLLNLKHVQDNYTPYAWSNAMAIDILCDNENMQEYLVNNGIILMLHDALVFKDKSEKVTNILKLSVCNVILKLYKNTKYWTCFHDKEYFKNKSKNVKMFWKNLTKIKDKDKDKDKNKKGNAVNEEDEIVLDYIKVVEKIIELKNDSLQ